MKILGRPGKSIRGQENNGEIVDTEDSKKETDKEDKTAKIKADKKDSETNEDREVNEDDNEVI